MPKFLVMLRNVRSNRVPMYFLLPHIVSNPDRSAPQFWHEEIGPFELADEEVAAMRKAITDPLLSRHLPPEGRNLNTVISLYFRQELKQIAPEATDIRAFQIPEPMPADSLEETPTETLTSHPDCRCPRCNPANPLNKDPWARGY